MSEEGCADHEEMATQVTVTIERDMGTAELSVESAPLISEWWKPRLRPGKWYGIYHAQCEPYTAGHFCADDGGHDIWVTPDIGRDRKLLPNFKIDRWVNT